MDDQQDFEQVAPFILKTTSYGGRSLFSTAPIPVGTLIHISHFPCAHVIYREYRKFVCAWCFAYFGEERALPVIADDDTATCQQHTHKKKGPRSTGSGERFCCDACKDLWIADRIDNGGFKIMVDNALNGAIRRMKSNSSASVPAHEDLDLGDLDQDALDAAWRNACAATSPSASGPVIILNEMELELARFVASGVAQHHGHSSGTNAAPVLLPRSVLDLQDNELPYARRRPYIVGSHIRIYTFLRAALSPVFDSRVWGPDGGWVRAILGCDTGNSFGIREHAGSGHLLNGDDDGEVIFGWGLWADASFFNHDCTPNLSKTRSGRSWKFRTNRAIVGGEELCISYVDAEGGRAPDESGQKIKTEARRKLLAENWYFDCACGRCRTEMGVVDVVE
ncbi:SET domain-containing protein [Athelia psychrophila]|uniref:SET domain-containing protein n=1 Tax=Athelia psychrophila TaxID=1759441 RepID=A0A166PL16_9AGAM|nr:SET domain-containing protein [Fibularhizoctonia sp. CBS 109695]